MTYFIKRLLGFVAFAAVAFPVMPAVAGCSGPDCGCSAIVVPARTPLPQGVGTANPFTPPSESPPWYTPPGPSVTPASYIADCAADISLCVSSSVTLRSDTPPGGASKWADFSSFTPPTGYRTSSGCYSLGNGPCNAKATPASSPNAPTGVTNYQYNTAFPCEMIQDGKSIPGSDVGAVKEFRMRANESISFSFTTPPMGSLMPETVDAYGNPMTPVYRSISFSDWNNPFAIKPVKFVTISKTSGDFNTVKAAANDPCYQSGVSGELKYTIIDSSKTAMEALYLPADVCPLEAGQTYYINVRFQDPKDILLTQGAVTSSDDAAVQLAHDNLAKAQQALNDALKVPSSDPGIVAAQKDLDDAVNDPTYIGTTGSLTLARKALDDALAATPPDPATVTARQNELNAIQAEYDKAVSVAMAALAAATANAPPTGSVTATTDEILALTKAVQDATEAYKDALAANSSSTGGKATFIQDTCTWSQCSSDQMHSNPSNPNIDTIANAYRKEWQCVHDLAAYWTIPSVKLFCDTIATGVGPAGCTPGHYDSDYNWVEGNCYPYAKVDPTQCVGNRIITGGTAGWVDGGGHYDYDGNWVVDPPVWSNTYTYGYTGGTPIKDCGVSLDMGCGLSAN